MNTRYSKKTSLLASIVIAAFLVSLTLTAFSIEVYAIDVSEAGALDVEVSMVDVYQLYVVDFILHYNAEHVELVEAVPIPPWSSYMIIKDEINAEAGTYRLVMVALAPAIPFDGSAALATLKFLPIEGEADFQLAVNALGDPKGRLIPHTVEGLVIKGTLVHDVAVMNIRGRPKGTYQGGILQVYVETENQGNFAETFSLTLYADQDTTTIGDELVLGTQTVDGLAAKEATFVTFIWDTTGVDYGTYWLSAEASVVPGETDIEDNFLKVGEYIGGIYPPPAVRQRADLLTQITSALLTISIAFACVFYVKKSWFP